ncbi:hypothetical protein ACKKBF_B30600 [Auxenochlorella protothecoides x Auxenochlorella symbiontica]
MGDPQPFSLPHTITQEWVREFERVLLDLSRQPPRSLTGAVSSDLLLSILTQAECTLRAEPTLLEVDPQGASVTVVGDTHGQFHDVCHIFKVAGYPSPTSLFIFNGDFVDRGSWGLETLLLLLAWKLAAPQHVHLLRGNHETALCTMVYGFKGELVAKLGRGKWKEVYGGCKRVFSVLPLAARVAKTTLILHGGLFRKPNPPNRARQKRRKINALELGSLEDLRAAHKGGMDPNGTGAARLATDVLWSDPLLDPGFQFNTTRNIGMVFGPDVTQRFLEENGLRLILRSHEGPDAREGREDLSPMTEGHTLDHDTPAGRLMTVFSAPDYPQFVPESHARYNNKAALAVLTAPDYAAPTFLQFEAVRPRPMAHPYYDLGVPDSDEELEPLASDASGMTDVEQDTSTTSEASVSVALPAGRGGEEVASVGADAP